MEERLLATEDRNIIPQKNHAIWVGNPPDSNVLDNLANWAKTNKNYQVFLWVDSSTYSAAQQVEYKQTIEFAKKNNIQICDIALNPKKGRELGVLGRNEIYNNMLSQTYYDDEVHGQYKNLAAASDILRVEILHQEGGIYLDAGDILPAQPLPEKMVAEFGFYVHKLEGGFTNNDILASVPNGTLINTYREEIHKGYQQLYQDTQRLNAHRNSEFTSPSLWTGGNPRKFSTIQTSGPGALDRMLMRHSDEQTPIPESKGNTITFENEHLLGFDNKYVATPEHGQDLSWFQAKKEYKDIVPIVHNYTREYFNNII